MSAPYIEEIRTRLKASTRRHLRRVFFLGTAKKVPGNVNLRDYVSLWHARQHEINGGAKPSAFWLRATQIGGDK